MNVIISNKYQAVLGSLTIDVIKTINGEFSADDIISQFKTFFYNKMIIDVTAIKEYQQIRTIQSLSLNMDMSNVILLLDDSPEVNSPQYLSQLVSMGIYNFTRKADSIMYLIDHPNQYKDVAKFQQLNGENPSMEFNTKIEKQETTGFIGQRIIGIKNITAHAGATTLIYMLHKHLKNKYKVVAVELGRNDFSHFSDVKMDSIEATDFSNYINSNLDKEVILVDLNENPETYCTEVINLIEPGFIKLNKLIKKDAMIFQKLKDQKIVLNRSVLSDKDVSDFEKESGSKVLFNLPNIDDKLDKVDKIVELLVYLGFTRINENSDDKGIFGIF